MSRKRMVSWAAMGLCLFWSAAAVMAATPQQVDAAIAKAVQYLLQAQNAAGNWEQPNPAAANNPAQANNYKGGLTSIAVYALLAAGENKKSPALIKAIKYLQETQLQGTYATALRSQVWLLLDDYKSNRSIMDRDARSLIGGACNEPGKEQDASYGFYIYCLDRTLDNHSYDRSNSQYGVLGIWALEQAGVEIPSSYWKMEDVAWRRAQSADGGWSYNGGDPTVTMTSAGIATLYIIQDYTLGNLAECKGNVTNENIERGLAWMDKYVATFLSGAPNYYGLYGIERIGVASGRKYFNTFDWYATGADILVKKQSQDGAWDGTWDRVANAAFSVLFLVRGRAPVVMNKLEYSMLERTRTVVGPWNERPRDCANFARWMGRRLERDLNWQIVNLKVSSADLHDAPILYISGNKELYFSNDEIAKLRSFAEEGGLILGNADCGSPAFSTSFVRLGHLLFPKYEFRDLSPNHVIYTDEQYKTTKWRKHPRVKGLSNGVRELMLLVPEADLSRAFQGRNEKTSEEVYQLAANIFLYSVDKSNLAKKGVTYMVKQDPAIVPTRQLTLARLQLGDNWNPEPAGWRQMAARFCNQDGIALVVRNATADPQSLAGAQIAHLTGTTAFVMNTAQRDALKQFVSDGHLLIVDSAGGNTAFADAAEKELKSIFGQAPQLIPADSPLFNLPSAKIETFLYRPFAKKITAGLRTPRLTGIEVNGRLAVVFSREDLSAGIVGEPVDGIFGYDPATAIAIMRNLLLSASSGATSVTAAPGPIARQPDAPAAITTKQPTDSQQLPGGTWNTAAFDAQFNRVRTRYDPSTNKVTWLLERKTDGSTDFDVAFYDEDEVKLAVASIIFEPSINQVKKGERLRGSVDLPPADKIPNVRRVLVARHGS